MNDYPFWYRQAAEELDSDLEYGLITFAQYNRGMNELDEELWSEWDESC